MKIWTDGNPEKCCVVVEGGLPEIWEFDEKLEAPYFEWEAMLKGAEKAVELESNHVELINDNKVVVKQLCMDYQITSEDIRNYAEKIWNMLKENGKEVEFVYEGRKRNKAGKPLG